MLEFKRAWDTVETYYSDMKSIAERQHTPILEGLNALAEERGWMVEVLPLVAGQRSVREKEWQEAMKTFGISAEDGKRIIYRLGHIVVYCCQSMRNCSEVIGDKYSDPLVV